MYVVAPLPVKVAEAPTQIAVGLDTAVTVGFEFTTKFTVLVAVQPKVVVPTTVYIVVAVGVTETAVPDNAPGFHVYVEAPEPVNVAEAPAQIAVGLATAFTVD